MNLTTAITCFFKKTLAVNAIPFALVRPRPKAETLEAMAEARRIARDPSVPAYDNMEDSCGVSRYETPSPDLFKNWVA